MKYLIFSLIIVLAILQIAFYYPKLPDTVASHFGASGEADGFMSKKTFCMFEAGLIFLMTILFGCSGFTLRYLPDRFLNLPNKDYWLTPERSAQTKHYIQNWMLIFGAVTLIFLLCIFQLTILANLNATNKLSTSRLWIALGIYLAYTAISTILLLIRFSRIPHDAETGNAYE